MNNTHKTMGALLILLLSAPLWAHDSKVVNLTPTCAFGDLRIDSDIPMGRVSECSQIGKNQYSINIKPENRPVNDSAWYAFKIYAEKKRSIRLYMNYDYSTHRYAPKVSSDGNTWALMSEKNYQLLYDDKTVKFNLKVGPQPLWVAGQQILSNQDHHDWEDKVAQHDFVEKRLLGNSAEGRPIYKLETNSAKRPGYVVIVGRQHPPEVTGALALMPFVEEVFGDTELAKQFREKFNLVVVPNMNPDGVQHGHWRHGTGGIDLNRDWGPFTQKETQLMRDELTRFKGEDGDALYLFLDFHSTHKNIFYTQPDDKKNFPQGFTEQWLAALLKRIPGFVMERKDGHNPGLPTSRNYVHENYGITAITYEMADATGTEEIKIIAERAAQEMMKLLLSSYQE
ncbi:M14 family metallopeptidase [Porticoccus sp. W117]|uniref:M14 family metallopeptidase n=1 Tax=Porticoccus sp. W117 TaxID=3054777 RepID=UPI002596C8DD|nr:M14 family metallopeptidase [Porticoccus sp. W117]MDM3870748.1 M14 family metallopeptidase [Porticoccus sp. W117]